MARRAGMAEIVSHVAKATVCLHGNRVNGMFALTGLADLFPVGHQVAARAFAPACEQNTHTNAHARTHTHTHARAHTCIHARVHRDMHTQRERETKPCARIHGTCVQINDSGSTSALIVGMRPRIKGTKQLSQKQLAFQHVVATRVRREPGRRYLVNTAHGGATLAFEDSDVAAFDRVLTH